MGRLLLLVDGDPGQFPPRCHSETKVFIRKRRSKAAGRLVGPQGQDTERPPHRASTLGNPREPRAHRLSPYPSDHERGNNDGGRLVDPMIDLLILTGFLAALFAALGAIAGALEWWEKRLLRGTADRPTASTPRRPTAVAGGKGSHSSTPAEKRRTGGAVRIIRGIAQAHRRAA